MFCAVERTQRIPGLVSCRCLEPGWFVGDPTSPARDNIYAMYSRPTFNCIKGLRFGGKLVQLIPVSDNAYLNSGTNAWPKQQS